MTTKTNGTDVATTEYLSRIHYDALAGDYQFNIPFDYADTSTLTISKNGVPYTSNEYTLTSTHTLHLNTPLTEPARISIVRTTDLSARAVDFVNAAELTEQDLDASAEQVFYAMQEAYDNSLDTLKPEADGSMSMSGKRLADVGAPYYDDDASTKKYTDAGFAAAIADNKSVRDHATAEANRSAEAANLAESHKQTAYGYSEQARQQADRAESLNAQALLDIADAATEEITKVNAAGTTQVAAVDEAGVVQTGRVVAQGDSQINRVISQGTTDVNRVEAQGDASVLDVTNEGDTQINRVISQGTTECSAITSLSTSEKNSLVLEGDAQVSRVENAATQEITPITDEGDLQMSRIQAEGGAQVTAVGTKGNDERTAMTIHATDEIERITTATDTIESRVTDEGNEQVQRLKTESGVQVSTVNNAGSTQVGYVNSAGNTQVNRVTSEGDTQDSRVEAEGSAQVSRVTGAGDTQAARIATDGDAVIADAQAQADRAEFHADRAEEISTGEHSHDSRYYTEGEVDSMLGLKSDATHNHDNRYSLSGHQHDGRYYQRSEVLGLLDDKSDKTHDHDADYLGKTATASNANKFQGFVPYVPATATKGVAMVDANGIMEVGDMIDFHTDDDGSDHSSRLRVTKTTVDFEDAEELRVKGGYKVFHENHFPTATELGAAPVNHDHDSEYLGVNATAVDTVKFGGKLPSYYATAAHSHNEYLPASGKAVNSALLDSKAASYFASASNLTAHTGDTTNPHNVDKGDVGLGNVQNLSLSNSYTDGTTTAYASSLAVNNLYKHVSGGYIKSNAETVVGSSGRVVFDHSGSELVFKDNVGDVDYFRVTASDAYGGTVCYLGRTLKILPEGSAPTDIYKGAYINSSGKITSYAGFSSYGLVDIDDPYDFKVGYFHPFTHTTKAYTNKTNSTSYVSGTYKGGKFENYTIEDSLCFLRQVSESQYQVMGEIRLDKVLRAAAFSHYSDSMYMYIDLVNMIGLGTSFDEAHGVASFETYGGRTHNVQLIYQYMSYRHKMRMYVEDAVKAELFTNSSSDQTRDLTVKFNITLTKN